jgi:hypothetical protein
MGDLLSDCDLVKEEIQVSKHDQPRFEFSSYVNLVNPGDSNEFSLPIKRKYV